LQDFGCSKQQESNKIRKEDRPWRNLGTEQRPNDNKGKGLTGNFDLQKGQLPSFLCIVSFMKKIGIPGSVKPTANEDAKARIKCKENLYCDYSKRGPTEAVLTGFLLVFWY